MNNNFIKKYFLNYIKIINAMESTRDIKVLDETEISRAEVTAKLEKFLENNGEAMDSMCACVMCAYLRQQQE